MNAATRKRPYETVALHEAGEGYHLLLDGKPARTPAGNNLLLSSLALAEAVRGEFAAQEEKINPAAMPLTALMCTSIDRTEPQRQAVTEAILAYGETDLLCYREADEPKLRAWQEAEWGPVLEWAKVALGAPLRVAEGVIPVAQPTDAVQALHAALKGYSAPALTAIGALAQTTGSLILALALTCGHIGAAEAARLALLDEEYQAQKWGRDEVAEERRQGIVKELERLEKFLALMR